LELLGHEDTVDVREVVRWLQADPAFSGGMLRVANYALDGLRAEIRSVHQATMNLGLDFVKALVITVGLRAYGKSAVKAPVLRRRWTPQHGMRHSFSGAWPEKVVNDLPDAAKQRVPNDIEVLKARIQDRIRALV
jgi:hypothetical protein